MADQPASDAPQGPTPHQAELLAATQPHPVPVAVIVDHVPGPKGVVVTVQIRTCTGIHQIFLPPEVAREVAGNLQAHASGLTIASGPN